MSTPLSRYLLTKILPGVVASLSVAVSSGIFYIANGVHKSNAYIKTHDVDHAGHNMRVIQKLNSMSEDMEIVMHAVTVNAANTSYILQLQGLEPIKVPPLHSPAIQ